MQMFMFRTGDASALAEMNGEPLEERDNHPRQPSQVEPEILDLARCRLVETVPA